MPHSSGGGSHGGGFHGGSSSGSSGSSTRYSNKPFASATCYVYYGRNYAPRLIYTNSTSINNEKVPWFSFIFMSIIFLFPIALFLFTGYHHPEKLKVDYDTSIVISDQNNVLSDAEEIELKEVFGTFLDKTGITPAFMSVDNIMTRYSGSLEDYAYSEYINHFKDEKHWLIVYYSTKDTKKDNWAFEGMQGNDTDSILYTRVTDLFNNTFYNELEDDTITVGRALIDSFNKAKETAMDEIYYLDTSSIVLTIVFTVIFASLITFTIISAKRASRLKDAVKAPSNNPVLKKCAHCGCAYYAETVFGCPKCGQPVEFPPQPHIPDVDK
ncbi:MAG: hypothetical protein J6X50_01975 [Bacilli bacterium]|nr:hypothetical protein [Bacilli bacterium]